MDKVRKAVNMERPLEGSKIIVDAGNGAGGFFATKVLEKLVKPFKYFCGWQRQVFGERD